ncbi:MAG: oxidoreductase [Planctomycetes bacterium]|nr:oxidoreductase [Planctomycetota bacterium]
MVRNLVLTVISFCLLTAFVSCTMQEEGNTKDTSAGGKVKLMILNPGHYHAALVQKSMYEKVAPDAYVYAPAGPEVQEYLKRIESFNNRSEEPTSWQEKVYTGYDHLEKMLYEKPGNVVVMSGNNQKKTMYIRSAVDAGFNVFSDKPMCIDAAGFRFLEQAFDTAEQNGVLLYDIMTERFNILCILQKMLVLDKDVFGELKKGTVDEPAVVKESVHHFFKYISGIPIKRPTWYFDSAQQGEGLVDVTTHLIDLMMWTCFPDEAIDYQKDVVVLQARRWPTMLTQQQYEKVTRAPDFPRFLKGKLNDEGILPYYSNGEMVFEMKDIYMKLAVSWNFQAQEGAGDTHHSLFRGTKANVIIRQGKEENYRPELYVEPAPGASVIRLSAALEKAVAELQSKYPGLELKRLRTSWQIAIPDEHRIGHEAHFRIVTEKYLKYLEQGKLPDWEVSNMLTKYYITTRALELARQ